MLKTSKTIGFPQSCENSRQCSRHWKFLFAIFIQIQLGCSHKWMSNEEEELYCACTGNHCNRDLATASLNKAVRMTVIITELIAVIFICLIVCPSLLTWFANKKLFITCKCWSQLVSMFEFNSIRNRFQIINLLKF